MRSLESVSHRLPSLLSHIDNRRVARTCDESGQRERKLEWGVNRTWIQAFGPRN
jgi:hypothetical protein